MRREARVAIVALTSAVVLLSGSPPASAVAGDPAPEASPPAGTAPEAVESAATEPTTPQESQSVQAPTGSARHFRHPRSVGPALPRDLFSANGVSVPPSAVPVSAMSAKQRAMRRNVWMTQGPAFSVGIQQSTAGRVGGSGVATLSFARSAAPGVAARRVSVRITADGAVSRAIGDDWRCRTKSGVGLCTLARPATLRSRAVPPNIDIQVEGRRQDGHQATVKATANWQEQGVVAGIGGGHGALGTFRSTGWLARSTAASGAVDIDQRMRLSASAVTGSPFFVAPGSPAGRRTVQLQGRLRGVEGRQVSTRWSQLCTTPKSANRVAQCRGVTPRVDFLDEQRESASASVVPQNVVLPPLQRSHRFVFQVTATGGGATERRRVVVNALTGRSGKVDPRLKRVPDVLRHLSKSKTKITKGAKPAITAVQIAPALTHTGRLQVIPGSRVRLSVKSAVAIRSVKWRVIRGSSGPLTTPSASSVSFRAPDHPQAVVVGADIRLKGGRQVSATKLVMVRSQHRTNCLAANCKAPEPTSLVCTVAQRLDDPSRTDPDVVMSGDARLFLGAGAALSGECTEPMARVTFTRATLEKDGYRLEGVTGHVDQGGVHVTKADLSLPASWRTALDTDDRTVELTAPDDFDVASQVNRDGTLGPLVGNLLLPAGALGFVPLPEDWDMVGSGAGAPTLQFAADRVTTLVELGAQSAPSGGGRVGFEITVEPDGRTRIAVVATDVAVMTDKRGNTLNLAGEGAVYFDQQGRFAATRVDLRTVCRNTTQTSESCDFEMLDGVAVSQLGVTWSWDSAKKTQISLTAKGRLGLGTQQVSASLAGTYRTATDWSLSVDLLDKWSFAEGFSVDSGTGTISMKKVNGTPRLLVSVGLKGLRTTGVSVENATATITNDCFTGATCSALSIRVKIEGKLRIVIGEPLPDLVVDVTLWADLAARTVKLQVSGFPNFGPEGYVIEVQSLTLRQTPSERLCSPTDTATPGAAIGFTGSVRTTGSKEVNIPVGGEFDVSSGGYCFIGKLPLRDTMLAYSTYRTVIANGGPGDIPVTKPGTLMMGGSMFIPAGGACPIAYSLLALDIDGIGSFNTRDCGKGVTIPWAAEVFFGDKQRQENLRIDARLLLGSGPWKVADMLEFGRLGLRMQFGLGTIGGQDLQGFSVGLEITGTWQNFVPIVGSISYSSESFTVALRVATESQAWTNAFGVEDLTVNELGLGLTAKWKTPDPGPKPPDPDPDPTPPPGPPTGATASRSYNFMVTGAVTLPSRWGEKVGLVNRPQVRLNFSVGVGAINSCAILEVARYNGSDVLRDKNVLELGPVSARFLRIVYAPMGCTVLDGSGGTLNIAKGWGFAFDGEVAGATVDAALTVRMPAKDGDEQARSFAMLGYLNIPNPIRWKGLELAGCDRQAGPGCVPAPNRGPRFDVDIDTATTTTQVPHYNVKVDASLRIGTEGTGARLGVTGSYSSTRVRQTDQWVTRADLAGTGSLRIYGTDLADARVNVKFSPLPYFDPAEGGLIQPYLKVDLAAQVNILGQGIAVSAGLDYADGDLQSFYAGAGVTLSLPGFSFSPDIFVEFCRGTLGAKRKNRDDAWKGCQRDKYKLHFRVYVAGKYKILWVERSIDMTLVDNYISGGTDQKSIDIPPAAPDPGQVDGKDILRNPDWKGLAYTEKPYDQRLPYRDKATIAVQLIGPKADPRVGVPACTFEKHGLVWEPTSTNRNPAPVGGVAPTPSPCGLEADVVMGNWSGSSFNTSQASRVRLTCTKEQCQFLNTNTQMTPYSSVVLEQWDKGMSSARASAEMILSFIRKQEEHQKELNCTSGVIPVLSEGKTLRCDGAVGIADFPRGPAQAEQIVDPFGMHLSVGTDPARTARIARVELNRTGELTVQKYLFQATGDRTNYVYQPDGVALRWKPQPEGKTYSDEDRRGSYVQLVRRNDRCYLKMVAPDRTTLGYLPNKGRWADNTFLDDSVTCQLTPLAQGGAIALGGPSVEQTLWLSDPDLRILRVANPTSNQLYLGEIAIDTRRYCVLAPDENQSMVNPDLLRGPLPPGSSRTTMVKKNVSGGCANQDGYFGVTLGAQKPAKDRWGFQDFTSWYGIQYLDFKNGAGRSEDMLAGGWNGPQGLPAGELKQASKPKSPFQLFQFALR